MNVYIGFFRQFLAEVSPAVDDNMVWRILLDVEKQVSDDRLQCDLSFFENAVTPDTLGRITDIGIFPDCRKSDEGREIVFSGRVAWRIPTLRDRVAEYYAGNESLSIG